MKLTDHGAADAHGVVAGADGKARGISLHHEGGDALGPQLVVGEGVDAEVVGQGAVGDKALAAVDDVLVSVPLGEGQHTADVGAGGGLSQTEGTQMPVPEHRGHEALKLLIGGLGEVQAAAIQRGGNGERDTQGGVHFGDLFHSQGVFHVTQPLTAVFLGIGKTDESHVAQIFVEVHIVLAGLVPFKDLGSHLFLGEVTGHFLDRELLFVQFKVHDGIVSFFALVRTNWPA